MLEYSQTISQRVSLLPPEVDKTALTNGVVANLELRESSEVLLPSLPLPSYPLSSLPILFSSLPSPPFLF